MSAITVRPVVVLSVILHVFGCEKTAFGCREGEDGSEEIYCSFKKHSFGDAVKKVESDIDSVLIFFSPSNDNQVTAAPITKQPSFDSSRNEPYSPSQQPYQSLPYDSPYYGSDSVRRK